MSEGQLQKVKRGDTTMQKIQSIAIRVAQAVLVVVSIAVASGANHQW